MIHRGVLQDCESIDTTHQKGPAFLLDGGVRNLLWRYEEEVENRINISHSKHNQDFWGILWCFVL